MRFKYRKTLYYFPPNQIYVWSGWFGCQLASWEWRRVPAGTVRRLYFDFDKFIDITVASTRRDGLKIYTTWAVSKSGTPDEHVERIKNLQRLLKELN